MSKVCVYERIDLWNIARGRTAASFSTTQTRATAPWRASCAAAASSTPECSRRGHHARCLGRPDGRSHPADAVIRSRRRCWRRLRDSLGELQAEIVRLEGLTMLGRLRCGGRVVRLRSPAAASWRRSLSASSATSPPPPPRVFETVGAYRAFRGALPPGASVGLVPTMGYLHDGHLALARSARRECDVVVATIFVNPTQFAAHEDLGTYPRDPERDLELLHGAGVDAVLLPESDEIYGAGHTIAVEPGPDFSSLAEGAARGAHFFRGVATVVTKLFNITQPTRAYFGQKDAMQCVLIRKLVRELNFPTEVVIVPTQREPDGLAMSSRNVYLSPEERAAAPTLYRALSAIQAEYEDAGGEPVAASQLARAAMEVLSTEPLFTHVDYISIADPDSFQELTTVQPSRVAGGGANAAVVSAAVQIGKTRLLDNILL